MAIRIGRALRPRRDFVVLAEALHWGRAAQRLHLSPPPLSVNIQQPKATLGVQRFERNPHGVRAHRGLRAR